MDDFYKPSTCTDCLPQRLLSKIYHSIPIPPAVLATLLLGPLLIFLTAQLLLIGAPPNPEEEKEMSSWMVPFQPVPWRVLESFFGVPKRSEDKYREASEDLNACNRYILDEPHMTTILSIMSKNLELNIPQMISFIDTPIDLQPWEQHAQARFISSSETELDLQSLLRDMIGHALVPAVFGHALLEKYPDILHDVYDMDAGRNYLLKKLPPWTPWPGVVQAHMALFKVWQCLDGHQKGIDATVAGMGADASWGDLEDVSELIMKRNAVYREHGFELKERADITIFWSLTASPTLMVYWQILHILSTPNLLSRIRTELAIHSTIAKPFSIGTISEAPKLVLAHEGLAEKCPLLRSTYLETLRLVNHGWVASQHSINEVSSKDEIAFPETFNPERFLETAGEESGSNSKKGGEDESMHKGKLFVERVSLAVVAAILVFWDFETAEKGSGWKIPEKLGLGGIALPTNDMRVRVKRRRFEWVD